MLKAVAPTASGSFASVPIFFHKPIRMINAESQKIQMETTYPMMLMARGVCFSPVRAMTFRAITSSAPRRSIKEPMSVPAMITIPMLLMVPPNPADSRFSVSVTP